MSTLRTVAGILIVSASILAVWAIGVYFLGIY
jgi:hypothetical protein